MNEQRCLYLYLQRSSSPVFKSLLNKFFLLLSRTPTAVFAQFRVIPTHLRAPLANPPFTNNFRITLRPASPHVLQVYSIRLERSPSPAIMSLDSKDNVRGIVKSATTSASALCTNFARIIASPAGDRANVVSGSHAAVLLVERV